MRKKLKCLLKDIKSKMQDKAKIGFIRNVHNYSSYILSRQRETALVFGLEQHAPKRFKWIYTEFDQF